MALKTFNLDEDMYKKYSIHCKKEGISMSKQIDRFISDEVSRIQSVKTSSIKESPVAPHQQHTHNEHTMRKFC